LGPQAEEKADALAASKKVAASALVSAIRNSLKEPSAKEITDLGDMHRAMVDDQKTDTKLKKIYAYWFISILISQLVAMNLVFVAVGRNLLSFSEPSHLNLFMGGTLTEVFGVVYVITRYLFSKRENSSATGGTTAKFAREK
jgi:hypothetical protein